MQSREPSRGNRRPSFVPRPRAVVETLEFRTLLSAAYTVTDLGEFPAGTDNGSHDAFPTGVTDNGTVVGHATRNLGGQLAAFIWTAVAGMTKLGSVNTMNPDDPANNTIANAIASGFIVGESDGMPVIWSILNTAPSQLQLPSGATAGNAQAIAGSTIAGQVSSPSFGDVAVEWDANGEPLNRGPADNIRGLADVNGNLDSVGTVLGTNGLEEADFNDSAIGFLPNGSLSVATAINNSLDIVGFSTITGSPTVTQAFIDPNGSGMHGLGFLSNTQNSQANAINDSGLVVGQSYPGGGSVGEAFIWSQTGGMKNLNSMLPAHSGWKLQNATAISPAGLIVGTGINPQGQAAAFLLTPRSSAVVMAGALFPTLAKATIPSAIIAGTTVHGAALLELANQTAATERGTATLNIYASGDGSIDGTATLVASVKHTVNVRAGKSQAVRVPIKSFPPTLPAGSYRLVGEVVDAAGASEGNPGPAVTVAAPFISLSASMSAITARTLKSGVTITLTNGGNIADSGPFTDSIGFSTDAAGQDAVGNPLAGTLLNNGARIKPAKSAKKHVTGWSKLTSVLSTGQYYLTVTIHDSQGHSAEAVSATPVTVG